jgi:transposase
MTWHHGGADDLKGGFMSESEYQFFVGVDWGSETHVVCVLDRDRQRIAERSVPHTGVGLNDLADELMALAPSEPGRIAVAIEVPRGAIVDTLLERGMHIFSINPKQLDRFRDRHTVAGAKDDRRDAFVLADSLRTDRPAFRRVQPDHPRVVELRELSRIDDDLGQELRRLSNRLREQLHRFFPQALSLCPAADDPWFWALLDRARPPAHAQRLPAKTVAAVLKVYRVRRFTVATIREALQTPALHVAPGTVEAASAHIALLLPRLRLLHEQRTTVARRIEALLEELGTEEMPGEHRDVTILRSLPGVGKVVAATVLAEAAQPLAERDYQMLRAHGGIAPVTRKSGKNVSVSMRYACNPRLRNAFYHWARTSVQSDAHCRDHYDRLRQQGHGHARALRGVADRSLGVLVAMLTSRTLYDPEQRRKIVA